MEASKAPQMESFSFLPAEGNNDPDTLFEQPSLRSPPEQGSLGTMGQVNWTNFICLSRHPVAAFFHLIFKVMAIFIYTFQYWLNVSYIVCFVFVTLLLALDFYTTKNITGRLLVGLRWWNRMREDGQSDWIFESSPDSSRVPSLDYRIFWYSLYIFPIVFFVFFFSAFITLQWGWAVIDAVAVVLLGANLYGYYKCSSDAQQKLQATFNSGLGAIGRFGVSAALNNSSFLGGLFNRPVGAAAPTVDGSQNAYPSV